MLDFVEKMQAKQGSADVVQKILGDALSAVHVQLLQNILDELKKANSFLQTISDKGTTHDAKLGQMYGMLGQIDTTMKHMGAAHAELLKTGTKKVGS